MHRFHFFSVLQLFCMRHQISASFRLFFVISFENFCFNIFFIFTCMSRLTSYELFFLIIKF